MKWCDICGSALVVIDTKSVCSNALSHGYHRDFTPERNTTMTAMTPLARKLQIVYRNSATTDNNDIGSRWNKVAETAEAELATPRPIRLPTVEEFAIAYENVSYGFRLDTNRKPSSASMNAAQALLDVVAKLNPTWVPVPADATIPKGTRVRVEFQDYAPRAQEWAAEVDKTPAMRLGGVYFVPSGTVLTTPLDPRIEAAAKAIHDVERQDGEVEWDDEYPATRDTYVKLAKAAADALGVTL